MGDKILFLTFLSIVDGNGISNKILDQVEGLRTNGCEAHLMNYKIIDGQYYLMLDGEKFYKLGGFARHFNKSGMFRAIESYIIENKLNVLYYRYNMYATGTLVSFFKRLEGKCKRVLEIPTYPYDAEFSKASFSLRVVNFVERYYRKKYCHCVDRIVTFIDEKEIFGVPTIKISNAVNPNAIPLSGAIHNTGEVRMLAVANINFWHGFDRIIKGVRDYYDGQDRKVPHVTLTIVGDGNNEVKSELVQLVNENNLGDYIRFVGNTSGKALDDLFNNADMAVGCLACHRKDIITVKSLKNVEYAMRGLPFIYSEINDDFDDKPYVIKMKADESPINITELIEKYNNINCTPQEIRDSVKDLTWNYQMGIVIKNVC